MALAALLVGCAGGAAPDPEVLPVPVREADGTIRHIPARLCRPPGTGPARLVVVNHGSPGEGRAARSRYRLLPCGSAVARHFLARGQAVLAPLRRGYGEDAGAWAEDFGSCGAPDYARAGRETARDIRAALEAVRGLPGLAPDGIAVVGQSAGGWGVLALAADPPPGVSALVAVAPGRGGHMRGEANRNCNPGRLAEDAGRLALRPQTDARPALPVLWLHTPNDSYFAPALVRAMHAAHAGAGGQASLVELPAFGKDGHDLFYAPAGAASWGAPMDGWIDAHP